jgi:menaquinone-dependent protoporphyrinogen oxidase
MSATNILIAYGSSYGQTARIARRLGERLQQRGLQVSVVDARQAGPDLSPAGYAGVLVGSSLIARGVQPAIRRFVAHNLAALNATCSAYFQVSASAGSKDLEGREEAVAALRAYLKSSGWTPQLTASIAGAINYTRYNFLLRWFMKRISAKHGGATDTSRDHEYTDWAQVDRFADDFADVLAVEQARAVAEHRPVPVG